MEALNFQEHCYPHLTHAAFTVLDGQGFEIFVGPKASNEASPHWHHRRRTLAALLEGETAPWVEGASERRVHGAGGNALDHRQALDAVLNGRSCGEQVDRVGVDGVFEDLAPLPAPPRSGPWTSRRPGYTQCRPRPSRG